MQNLSIDPIRFSLEAAHFLLRGAHGFIECRTQAAESSIARRGSVIICHPHPLHGGSMDNKVVSTIERALRELGLSTVRFNFRGVGLSEGVHDGGIGEVAEVIEIAQWLQRTRPDDDLWLAGFSFGTFVSLQAASVLPCKQLISIAPAVTRWNFDHLKMPSCPWLVVMGEKDEIVDPQAVFDWIETLQPNPNLIRMPDTSHFFHGRLLELRAHLQTQLKTHLPPLELNPA